MDKTTETTWASAPLSLRRHPPRLHPRFHRQTKDGTHLIIEAKDEPEPGAEKAAMPKQKDISRQHRRQMGELKKTLV